jgi:hypothetical protein
VRGREGKGGGEGEEGKRDGKAWRKENARTVEPIILASLNAMRPFSGKT